MTNIHASKKIIEKNEKPIEVRQNETLEEIAKNIVRRARELANDVNYHPEQHFSGFRDVTKEYKYGSDKILYIKIQNNQDTDSIRIKFNLCSIVENELYFEMNDERRSIPLKNNQISQEAIDTFALDIVESYFSKKIDLQRSGPTPLRLCR